MTRCTPFILRALCAISLATTIACADSTAEDPADPPADTSSPTMPEEMPPAPDMPEDLGPSPMDKEDMDDGVVEIEDMRDMLEDLPDLDGGMDADPDLSDASPDADMRDCTIDTDGDGIPDCNEEEHPCLDPLKIDTDSDSLTDYEEAQVGSDPCTADTDGDGLRDDDELAFDTDPNNPVTFPVDGQPGPLDGDLFLSTACDDIEEEQIGIDDSSDGQFRIALVPSFGPLTQLQGSLGA